MTNKADIQPENSQGAERVDHLKAYRFRPGHSGNPGGRPRGRISLTALIREEASKNRGGRVKQVVQKLFSMAASGNLRAIELIIARVDDAAYSHPSAPETGGVSFTLNIGDKKINQDGNTRGQYAR